MTGSRSRNPEEILSKARFFKNCFPKKEEKKILGSSNREIENSRIG